MKKNTLVLLCLVLVLMQTAAFAAPVHMNTDAPESWTGNNILRITHLDTNRSDAFLIECGGEVMLVDGGYHSYSGHILNVLKAQGITYLDGILNTHPHDDHSEGAIDIIRAGIGVGIFMSPFEATYVDKKDKIATAIQTQLKKSSIPYYQLRDWEVIELGGAKITIRTLNINDTNSRSAMAIIVYGNAKMIMMADLTRGPQQTFLKEMGAEGLKCDIIKAPHHGLTPFDIPFLDACAPQLCTIPDKASSDNQIAPQCRVRKIDYLFSGSGDIIMETDGNEWYVKQLKQDEVNTKLLDRTRRTAATEVQTTEVSAQENTQGQVVTIDLR